MPYARRLPAMVAFALLALQVAIPWTVPRYVTQDGPSHVYGATLVRALLLNHSTSIYSNLYTIQHAAAVPNWIATIFLAIAGFPAGHAGANHAEQVFASFAALAGFLAFGYAVKALNPDASPWTPIANFLLQTWFPRVGFYNFYLGMVLLPLLLGFYIRFAGRLTPRRAIVISIGLAALFYTHLIPAALAVMAVIVTAIWLNACKGVSSAESGPRLRELGMVLAAAAPTLLLIAMFVRHPVDPVQFNPQIAWAWRSFPMHVFLTSGEGFNNRFWLIWPVALYIAAGILLMRKSEWRSARGGLAISALLTFLIYLFVPDEGLGGQAVKMRFAWGVFLIGGLAACSVSRLRAVRTPVALYLGVILCANLIASAKAAKAVSGVAEDYLSAAGQVEPKSTLVRLQYAAPGLPARYGYTGIGWDPLFHLDSLVAVNRQCLDLSDYEALSKIFPVVYKAKVDRGQQYGLWSFENPDNRSVETLVWLNHNFNVPIDYVLLAGDENSPEAGRQEMPGMLAYLTANMQLVATSPGSFLRLYRRKR